MQRFRRTANILRIIGSTSIIGIAVNLFTEGSRVERYLGNDSNQECRERVKTISRNPDYENFLIPFYNLFDDRYKNRLDIK